jgi:uracil-DNA glycosylase family 4
VTDAERQAALDTIAAEVAVCTRCRLHQTRTRAVPGEGTAATEVLFVGEGPGFNEDQQGRPFVGRAGALLSRLLESIGWSRREVFITNVVKCRPPENRDPEPDEIAACAPFLTRQIEALDPALIVTLGRFSMARFNPGARIGQVHGTCGPADPASGAPKAVAFFMYHPAAALRTSSVEETCFRDMAGVPSALLEARAIRAAQEAAPAPATTHDQARPEVDQDAREVELGGLVDATPGAESNPTAQLSLF